MELLQQQDIAGILDQARDGSVASAGGLLLDEYVSRKNGYPSREYSIKLPGEQRFSRLKLYLVGSRLFQQTAMGTAAQIKSSEANAFFDSFTFTQAEPLSSIDAMLEYLGFGFEVQENGDYKVLMEFSDENRTHSAFFTRFVSEFYSTEVFDIWAPIYKASGSLPDSVANHLLEQNAKVNLGSYQTIRTADNSSLVVYSYQLSNGLDVVTLQKAIFHVLVTADDTEKSLTKADNF